MVLCLTVSGGSLPVPGSRRLVLSLRPSSRCRWVGREGCPASCAHPQRVPLLPWCSNPSPSPRAPRSMPARVCTRLSLVRAVPSCAPISAAAPPLRLQGCKRFCISLFSSRLIAFESVPPPQPQRRRLPITQAAQGQPPPSGGQRWLRQAAATGAGELGATAGGGAGATGWVGASGGKGRSRAAAQPRWRPGRRPGRALRRGPVACRLPPGRARRGGGRLRARPGKACARRAAWGVWAAPRRGHQRAQGGRGWADAGGWDCVKSGFIFPIPRGEARASQGTGPSSSYVPWSNPPPETFPSSPNRLRREVLLPSGKTGPSASGKTQVSGPRSHGPHIRIPALRSPCFQERRKACYRLGRAHPWPGGIRTRWTIDEVSW